MRAVSAAAVRPGATIEQRLVTRTVRWLFSLLLCAFALCAAAPLTARAQALPVVLVALEATDQYPGAVTAHGQYYVNDKSYRPIAGSFGFIIWGDNFADAELHVSGTAPEFSRTFPWDEKQLSYMAVGSFYRDGDPSVSYRFYGEPVTFSMEEGIVISAKPEDVEFFAGAPTQPLTIAAEHNVSEEDPLDYLWTGFADPETTVEGNTLPVAAQAELPAGEYTFNCHISSLQRTPAWAEISPVDVEVKLTVRQRPEIVFTTQPESMSFTPGEVSGMLTAKAATNDGGELSYAWYSMDADGRLTLLTEGESYELPKDLEAGTYTIFCRASEQVGGLTASQDSSHATIKVKAQPSLSGPDSLPMGVIGRVGERTVTVTVSDSHSEDITVKCRFHTKLYEQSRVGDGDVSFEFPQADMNAVTEQGTKQLSFFTVESAGNWSTDKADTGVSVSMDFIHGFTVSPAEWDLGRRAENADTELPCAEFRVKGDSALGSLSLKGPSSENGYFVYETCEDWETPLADGTRILKVRPREGLPAGVYEDRITLDTQEGPSVTVDMAYEVCAPVILDIGADPGLELIEGQSATLSAQLSGGVEGAQYAYLWTWDGGSADTRSLAVDPVRSTEYNLQVTDLGDGAVYSAAATVSVTAATSGVEISPAELDFGQVRFGYEDLPEAQTVTLTYTGNGGSLTLSQPISPKGFSVGTLSRTVLDTENTQATFTVQPKPGLDVGDYSRDVWIKTDPKQPSDLTAEARLSVVPAGPDPVLNDPVRDSVVRTETDGTVTLSVYVENAETYQWSLDRNDGLGFQAIAGANGPNHTTLEITPGCDGFKYRCRITGAPGTTPVVSGNYVIRVVEGGLPATGESPVRPLLLAFSAAALLGLAVFAGRRRGDAADIPGG